MVAPPWDARAANAAHPQYKLYRLDGRRRIAGPPDVLEADSDDVAIVRASQVAGSAPWELWCSTRHVMTMWPAKAS
jgi:hypothetical protein